MDDNHQSSVELVPLNWLNLWAAWRLARNIFPKNVTEVFVSYIGALAPRWFWPKASREAIGKLNYYIAMKDRKPVGITGLYTFRDQPKEAWVGWYGVGEKFRGRGLGKATLQTTMDMARKSGYETLRLWTTPALAAANDLYQKLCFISQETDLTRRGRPILIYSFALSGGQPTLVQGNVRQYLTGGDVEAWPV
jgi:RimJ/RimL family protein N-acetyltransferase